MSKLLNDPNEMSFLDHLEDLRWHILRSFIAILICGSIAFVFKDFIFDKIIFGPKNVDFFTYEILCKISNFIGFNDGFCMDGILMVYVEYLHYLHLNIYIMEYCCSLKLPHHQLKL